MPIIRSPGAKMTGAVVALFAWAGMLASASISTPQVVRVVRRRSSLGVNRLTWSLSLCCFGCWCAYGAIRPLYFQVPGNAISMVGTLLLLGMLVRTDRTGLAIRLGQCCWRASPHFFYSVTSRRPASGGSHFSSRHPCVSRN